MSFGAAAGHRRLTVLACCLLLLAALAASGLAMVRSDASSRAQPVAVDVAIPSLRATSTGADGAQPWASPLAVAVDDGALVELTAVGPEGEPLDGELGSSTWRSTTDLLPSSMYTVTALLEDAAGAQSRRSLVVRTAPPERVLTAGLSPGDDAVVGVGTPVAVRLDGPVREPSARRALEERLTVESRPAVLGAWRWMTDTELHWRPASFWPAGTEVDVRVELDRLALPDGVWGSGVRTSRFTVGDAVVSTVDVAAHTMTVTRNGELLRVMRASMGRPEFPTRGGTHLVLEKQATRVMDSDTVGLPGEYEIEVESAVRLTYSGTFTHAAPWSVADQGVRNVSHGCINLSPEDARWFYDLARRGDVVHVVGTDVPPKLDDPGAADWNLTFEQWAAG